MRCVGLVTHRKAPATPASCPLHPFFLFPTWAVLHSLGQYFLPSVNRPLPSCSSTACSGAAAPLHPMLPLPGAQAGDPADLVLGELEHLHGLIHQGLVIALTQQPLAGTEVAEELGQRGRRGKRW